MALHAALAVYLEARGEREREDIARLLLESTLAATVPADASAILLLSRLHETPSNLSQVRPLAEAAVLRLVAAWVIETGDRLGLRELQEQLRRRLFRSDGALVGAYLDVASELAANLARHDHRRTHACWTWLWPLVRGHGGEHRAVACVRIGAAALLGGSISLASDIAWKLADDGVDLAALRTAISTPEALARERAWSELAGGYLGNDPDRALAMFLSYAIELDALGLTAPPARTDVAL